MENVSRGAELNALRDGGEREMMSLPRSVEQVIRNE